MRFLTCAECEVWIKAAGLEENIPTDENPYGFHTLRCSIPFEKLSWFSRYIVNSCVPFDRCLLRLGEQGVWPSSENLHLYYRLRQSYSDLRLMDEAPGHLFLHYEFEDLVTFVQLCLMFLWDADLLTNLDYMSVILSHDEFVEFRTRDESRLEPIHKELRSVGVRILK